MELNSWYFWFCCIKFHTSATLHAKWSAVNRFTLATRCGDKGRRHHHSSGNSALHWLIFIHMHFILFHWPCVRYYSTHGSWVHFTILTMLIVERLFSSFHNSLNNTPESVLQKPEFLCKYITNVWQYNTAHHHWVRKGVPCVSNATLTHHKVIISYKSS